MINDWLETIKNIITSNLWLAPVFAFLAGVLTSFTPCSLSSVPLVIGFVGGYAGNNTKRAFRYSLVFCIGMTITFTILGVLASIFGRIMQNAGSWWYIILGILMVLMALQMWGIINVIPAQTAISKQNKKGYTGAVLAGILGGFFASPCATPVLVVLLAIVAERGNIILGIILLLLYSAGHSVLLLVAGTSIGFVKQISSSHKFEKYSKTFNIIMGTIIILFAFYLFYTGF